MAERNVTVRSRVWERRGGRSSDRAVGKGRVGEGVVRAEQWWVFNEGGGQSMLKGQYWQKRGCEKGQYEWFKHQIRVSLGWQVGCLEEMPVSNKVNNGRRGTGFKKP